MKRDRNELHHTQNEANFHTIETAVYPKRHYDDTHDNEITNERAVPQAPSQLNRCVTEAAQCTQGDEVCSRTSHNQSGGKRVRKHGPKRRMRQREQEEDRYSGEGGSTKASTSSHCERAIRRNLAKKVTHDS